MIEVDSLTVIFVFFIFFYIGFRIGATEEYRPGFLLRVVLLLFIVTGMLEIVHGSDGHRYHASYYDSIFTLIGIGFIGAITGAVFVLNKRISDKYHTSIAVKKDFSICGKEYKENDCLYIKYSDSNSEQDKLFKVLKEMDAVTLLMEKTCLFSSDCTENDMKRMDEIREYISIGAGLISQDRAITMAVRTDHVKELKDKLGINDAQKKMIDMFFYNPAAWDRHQSMRQGNCS